MHAGQNLFLCVGLLALSGFKGVRFADLASLVKPNYFITDLSNAVLLIWFTVLFVLLPFLTVFHLLFVFYDIGSDGKVTLWERATRSVYNMFCTMSSLNKGDVHNCRLYVTIDIDTSVCVQVVRMILRITEG